jgi:hypothetical protein
MLSKKLCSLNALSFRSYKLLKQRFDWICLNQLSLWFLHSFLATSLFWQSANFRVTLSRKTITEPLIGANCDNCKLLRHFFQFWPAVPGP